MALANGLEKFRRKDVVIVALGDSNTELNHCSNARNWVSFFQQNTYDFFRKAIVVNSGVSGDDSVGAMNRLESDVFRFSPDIVIVSLGTNDSCRRTADRFSVHYRKLLLALLDKNYTVVTRKGNPAVNMKSGMEEQDEAAANGEFMRRIVEISKALGITCIDHYSLWKKSMKSRFRGEMVLLMGNHLHPNENGHRRFYHELAPYFGFEPHFQFEYQHLLDHEKDR